MREIIIKPSIRRRCQIAMCGNTVTNSISRTSAPAQAGFFMCDDCLREAYAARFGRATDHTDTDALKARNAALEAQVSRQMKELADLYEKLKAPAETPVNEPTQAETPKQGKPKGGKKK